MPPVRVKAVESGQLSGHCGPRVRLGGERRVANDPNTDIKSPRVHAGVLAFCMLTIAISVSNFGRGLGARHDKCVTGIL